MIPGCLIIKFTITQNAQYRNHFHNVLCLSEAKGMDINMKNIMDYEKGNEFPEEKDCEYSGLNIYTNKLSIENQIISNAIVLQPIECNDATTDGSPSEFSFRRYRKFAAGGAGIIWFETISICEQGKTNQHQLMLTEKNVKIFKRLLDDIYNINNEVICIAQISHGGEASMLNKTFTCENYGLLNELKNKYIYSAMLAVDAGFSGIDIKLCHGFLLGDVLFNFNRYSYLGGFHKRVDFVTGIIHEIKTKFSNIILAVRIDISDLLEKKDLDFNDLLFLIQELKINGVYLYNFSVKKYYIKNNKEKIEIYKTVYKKVFYYMKKIKEKNSDIFLVSPGLTLYGTDSLYLGEKLIKEYVCDLIGFGRQALAYPDFAYDILVKHKLDETKCCNLCGICSKLRRSGRMVGCPIYDDLYR